MSARHELPGEHAPTMVPAGILALAVACAAAGVAAAPRAQRALPTTERALPTTERALPTIEAPLLTIEAASPATARSLVEPAPSPEAPGDCPPRWSVRFHSGSSRAPEDLAARLAPLGSYLAAHPEATALLIGYADPAGSESSNEALSERRAAAVARALREAGVPRRRITARGVGALADEAEAAEMRRVAVRVRGVAVCAGTPEEVLGP